MSRPPAAIRPAWAGGAGAEEDDDAALNALTFGSSSAADDERWAAEAARHEHFLLAQHRGGGGGGAATAAAGDAEDADALNARTFDDMEAWDDSALSAPPALHSALLSPYPGHASSSAAAMGSMYPAADDGGGDEVDMRVRLYGIAQGRDAELLSRGSIALSGLHAVSALGEDDTAMDSSMLDSVLKALEEEEEEEDEEQQQQQQQHQQQMHRAAVEHEERQRVSAPRRLQHRLSTSHSLTPLRYVPSLACDRIGPRCGRGDGGGSGRGSPFPLPSASRVAQR